MHSSPRRRGRPPKQVVSSQSEALLLSLDAMLGPPPVIDGEDRQAYEVLSSRMKEDVKPSGAIETIWVRDITDLTWDILRLRRMKAALLRNCYARAAKELLNSQSHDRETEAHIKQLENGSWKNATAARAALQARDRGIDDLNALAFTYRRDSIECLDRMAMQAESRRNFALREIDRRRESIARRLRDSVKTIESEFSEVEARKAAPPSGRDKEVPA